MKEKLDSEPAKGVVLKAILVLFLTIAIVLSAANVAIKYTHDKKDYNLLNYVPPVKRYVSLREYLPLMDRLVTPDETTMRISDNLVQKEYRLRTDENGFIIPSEIYKNPDFSLVFLGGSQVESAFLDEEKRYPVLVGEILSERLGKKVNSYNGGIMGSNSLHSINLLLYKVIPLKPRFVILSHNYNDLLYLLNYGDYWSKHSPEPIIKEERSGLARIMRNGKDIIKDSTRLVFPYLYSRLLIFKDDIATVRLEARAKNSKDASPSRGEKKLPNQIGELKNDFIANLKLFIYIARSRGITPVLSIPSSRFIEKPEGKVNVSLQNWANSYNMDFNSFYKTFKGHHEAFNETIRLVGKSENALVVDMDRMVPKNKTYMYDLFHFTPEGARFVAGLIADQLINIDSSLM
ncbi:MAG: hypothetical protein HOG63_02100 [Nitrospina sp.]|nr:hypothetical protein [Nitrospina sp.]MBT4104277.1 hypothetical protein [Nitrospina sp.]MBT4390577.1 hypothetical protein [Nitrospina sp.]MBT4622118.1 hypothetical protein [Nitrospina sp.]MBT5261613.1 hypothetical protein [Nitrospina sp.]